MSDDYVSQDSPLIQTDEHTRLKAFGLRSIMGRLSTRSGIKITAHALRRTFARLSALNGLDTIWIQFLMGHENIQTTVSYIQELNVSDAERFYQEHAPLRDIKR